MGFEIYQIQPLANHRFALHWLCPMALGGVGGLLAQNIPMLAALGECWNLSAHDLLRLAGESDISSKSVFFNLTPKATDQANLFHMLSVSGKTMSMLTDALFHFKVACASRKRAEITGANGELIVSDWSHSPVRLEQLRLEGGSREPPQGASATVV